MSDFEDDTSLDTTIADADASFDGGLTGGDVGYSGDPEVGGYSPIPPISDSDASSNPISCELSTTDDGSVVIGPTLDGGYSSEPSVETSGEQSGGSPQPLPEGTVQGQPSGGYSPDGTYWMPEVTVYGEPHEDPMPGLRLPGICTPDGGISYEHEYDGPSVSALSQEDYERDVEAAKQQQENEDGWAKFLEPHDLDEGPPDRPVEEPPEPNPPTFVPPGVVFD